MLDEETQTQARTNDHLTGIFDISLWSDGKSPSLIIMSPMYARGYMMQIVHAQCCVCARQLPWLLALSRECPRLWTKPGYQLPLVQLTGKECPRKSLEQAIKPGALRKSQHISARATVPKRIAHMRVHTLKDEKWHWRAAPPTSTHIHKKMLRHVAPSTESCDFKFGGMVLMFKISYQVVKKYLVCECPGPYSGSFCHQTTQCYHEDEALPRREREKKKGRWDKDGEKKDKTNERNTNPPNRTSVKMLRGPSFNMSSNARVGGCRDQHLSRGVRSLGGLVIANHLRALNFWWCPLSWEHCEPQISSTSPFSFAL